MSSEDSHASIVESFVASATRFVDELTALAAASQTQPEFARALQLLAEQNAKLALLPVKAV